MKHKIDQYLKLLKQEHFFEAHEVLEEFWFPRRFEKSDEVQLVRGLINAAVSFELIKRGRIEASKRVWRNYLKYRTLLYKVVSKEYNEYHRAIRTVDMIKRELERM
ncbi:hypothetical protein MNB_SM-7-1465 [hydrothermal vent metagenome]|uniref:DUF309 domain-containing protein n=1 Tax=hydrothermal vent metagenome TaxID=652676 RepID=A0A1W1B8J6_9ZZZZ